MHIARKEFFMQQLISMIFFFFAVYCIYKRFSLKAIICTSALLVLLYWIGSHYLHLPMNPIVSLIIFAISIYAIYSFFKNRHHSSNMQNSQSNTLQNDSTSDMQQIETNTQTLQPLDDEIVNSIMNDPSAFYTQTSSIMNSNETRMFYYINKALDKLIANPNERSSFYVFPQVSLHSFIKIRTEELQDHPEELDTARRLLLNKNVDFIICKCQKRYFSTSGSTQHKQTYYEYQPFIMIELDGTSHFSPKYYGEKALFQQQKSDAFKNALSDNFTIPLIRHELPTNTIRREDYQKILEALRPYFSQNSILTK